LNQTFQDFELIVVDDGSTDNTRKVVEEFQKGDPRIKYIFQENSGGPAKPINTGIKNSKGEYITILEDDDEFLPQKLQKQVELFESSKRENLGFVGCDVLIVMEKEGKFEVYHTPKYKTKEAILKEILRGDFFYGFGRHLFKKEAIEKVGYLDENLKRKADHDLCLRMIKEYNFDFVPEILFKYYRHGENISGEALTFENQIIKDWQYFLEKHQLLYKNYPKIYSFVLKSVGTLFCFQATKKKEENIF
jgi:glycosyltransferase involved in cell wall biosynthesis